MSIWESVVCEDVFEFKIRTKLEWMADGLEVEEEDESDSYQDELDDKVYKGEKERGEVQMTSSPPGATCPQRT